MRGKHKNLLVHALAGFYRERLRWKIARLVAWQPLQHAEPGCTAIIGLSSRLPHVLGANMRCLYKSRWPELKRVLVTVDSTEEMFPREALRESIEAYPELQIEVLYYSPLQSAMAEQLKLPYVYSWLSWCIALSRVSTEHVLIHDYDALILGRTLEARYKRFVASDAKVQGIAWYKTNGIEPDDHLATTFEAFFDTKWLRSLRPVQLFNKLRLVNGRSIDFDTTLDAQLMLLKRSERTIVPMALDELVHPSQMIHQYTMFRRDPGKALPCGSIPMIPFFAFLGGNDEMLLHATQLLESGQGKDIDFLKDGTRINLTQLDLAMVDWQLKQMIQACLGLQIPPDSRIYRYGSALYRMIHTAEPDIWKGDFTALQRAWIDSASRADTAAPEQVAIVNKSVYG
jgi:hypothetical protein